MATGLSSFRFALRMLTTVSEARDNEVARVDDAGLDFSPFTALANGTSANQADREMQDRDRTLLSGNNETIDLFDFAGINLGAGSGRDLIGNTISLAEIVGIAVVSQSASAGTLIVGGGGATTAWNSLFNASDTAQAVVFPGGFLAAFAPPDPAYAVADVTNHTLRFEASGGNVTYDLYVYGRSA